MPTFHHHHPTPAISSAVAGRSACPPHALVWWFPQHICCACVPVCVCCAVLCCACAWVSLLHRCTVVIVVPCGGTSPYQNLPAETGMLSQCPSASSGCCLRLVWTTWLLWIILVRETHHVVLERIPVAFLYNLVVHRCRPARCC